MAEETNPFGSVGTSWVADAPLKQMQLGAQNLAMQRETAMSDYINKAQDENKSPLETYIGAMKFAAPAERMAGLKEQAVLANQNSLEKAKLMTQALTPVLTQFAKDGNYDAMGKITDTLYSSKAGDVNWQDIFNIASKAGFSVEGAQLKAVKDEATGKQKFVWINPKGQSREATDKTGKAYEPGMTEAQSAGLGLKEQSLNLAMQRLGLMTQRFDFAKQKVAETQWNDLIKTTLPKNPEIAKSSKAINESEINLGQLNQTQIINGKEVHNQEYDRNVGLRFVQAMGMTGGKVNLNSIKNAGGSKAWWDDFKRKAAYGFKGTLDEKDRKILNNFLLNNIEENAKVITRESKKLSGSTMIEGLTPEQIEQTIPVDYKRPLDLLENYHTYKDKSGYVSSISKDSGDPSKPKPSANDLEMIKAAQLKPNDPDSITVLNYWKGAY